PLPIRLMRSIEHLSLSPRRAEVCALMANGASVENIARRLGISTHTAVAHSRWIYDKLNVHTRTELLSKLLAVPVYRPASTTAVAPSAAPLWPVPVVNDFANCNKQNGCPTTTAKSLNMKHRMVALPRGIEPLFSP